MDQITGLHLRNHARPAGGTPARPLPWIEVARQSGYFVDSEGADWTPIGHNDAISWPELAGLFRRRDLPGVERHLRSLAAQGVTCLRLMLEYAQVRHRYIERPAGRFVPAMVQLWDDLFALCERTGIRILLTPVDTFWTWLHWRHHPWSRAQGGPCDHPSRLLLCPETRAAIKARLDFAVRRWGGSGALFAWDLWNEIHPAQAGDSADVFSDFIADLSHHVRSLEQELYGRSHPQTVSLFGPELVLKPHMDLAGPIFRHPDLDFATIHIYETGTIDNPRDTVRPALAMGRIVRRCLAEIRDGRPFLDTEHGPIHSFKDRHRTLPEPFDDQYFRHMSWAHLASGGVGGGMRWPNRHPHVLTEGMRRAQGAMAAFLPLVEWHRFRPRNLNEEASAPGFHTFACADDRQLVAWLVRRGGRDPSGMLYPGTQARSIRLAVPVASSGRWTARLFDTMNGEVMGTVSAVAAGGLLTIPFDTAHGDVAVAAVHEAHVAKPAWMPRGD
jgi:mannan endo-1,4-beta-mannosidase